MSLTCNSNACHLTGAKQTAYRTLIEKTRRNIADLVISPTTWSFDPKGDYSQWTEGFFDIGNWTTSFFTGMALIAWKETKDEDFIKKVLALDPLYRKKLDPEHAAETMHDLGFLYSLHSVALYKLTGESIHRELALKAAETLAARFIPEGNYIRAWGRMDEPDTDYADMAIIDCMMNLPLLYWASEETGDSRYKEIAMHHSDTTLANFIREDDSVYHAYRFGKDGKPSGGENYCGHSIESHWARGTAWAIYGFAMGYRYTGEERYLDASLRVTRRFISLLDDEMVPVWDFHLPDQPELHIRDTSAAAIAACGIQELEKLGKADDSLRATKTALLDKLCTSYIDTNPIIRGTLKHGQVGMAVDAYTSWGDYYLMEALARENGMEITWW